MSFTVKVRGAKPACFIADHRCFNCGHVWELSLENEAMHERENECWIGALDCPICESEQTERVIGTATAPVTIVRGNSDFTERQNERLYKRSSEHFKREGRDEAIERQRQQFKREGMVQ